MRTSHIPTPICGRNFKAAFLLLFLLVRFSSQSIQAASNVFLITADGLRWQEVFTGAEEVLIHPRIGGVKNPLEIREQFWRPTPEARREALLPFLWSTVAKQGKLMGNTNRGSIGKVVNRHHFSYPGYNEMLTGWPDSRIDSNDKRPNSNTNVFEWIARQPGFEGRVAAFASWDVFPFILGRHRGAFPIQAGWEPPSAKLVGPNVDLLRDLYRSTAPIWENMTLDSYLYLSTRAYLSQEKPRVIFLSFGETDEWAHEGRYDNYLRSARLFDQYLKELWEWVQSQPQYRDNTAFVLTTDHGRGTGPVEWKNHNKDLIDSSYIWLGLLGAGVTADGEVNEGPAFTQSQVASTVASLLGLDWRQHEPKAAAPLR